MLIGIHGKARSGKDTVARRLVMDYGFYRLPFADPVKRAAQVMFGLTDEQIWIDDSKETVIPYWGMTPREMFQKVGTEGGRDVFGDDLWIKRWALDYQSLQGKRVVVPDVRFENEAAFIRQLGGVILHLHSNRGTTLSHEAQAHRSEGGVRQQKLDFMIDNSGTFDQLYGKVDTLVRLLSKEERDGTVL